MTVRHRPWPRLPNARLGRVGAAVRAPPGKMERPEQIPMSCLLGSGRAVAPRRLEAHLRTRDRRAGDYDGGPRARQGAEHRGARRREGVDRRSRPDAPSRPRSPQAECKSSSTAPRSPARAEAAQVEGRAISVRRDHDEKSTSQPPEHRARHSQPGTHARRPLPFTGQGGLLAVTTANPAGMAASGLAAETASWSGGDPSL
jgi:hypothetical protein